MINEQELIKITIKDNKDDIFRSFEFKKEDWNKILIMDNNQIRWKYIKILAAGVMFWLLLGIKPGG